MSPPPAPLPVSPEDPPPSSVTVTPSPLKTTPTETEEKPPPTSSVTLSSAATTLSPLPPSPRKATPSLRTEKPRPPSSVTLSSESLSPLPPSPRTKESPSLSIVTQACKEISARDEALSAMEKKGLPLMVMLESRLTEPVISHILQEILKILEKGHHGQIMLDDLMVDEHGKIQVKKSSEVSADETDQIWGFVMIALHLAHGNAPFVPFNPVKLVQLTVKNENVLFYEKTFSEAFRAVLSHCMTKMTLPPLTHVFFNVASGKEFNDLLAATRESEMVPLQEEPYIFPSGSSKIEVSKDKYLASFSSWKKDVKNVSFKTQEGWIDMFEEEAIEEYD